MMLIRFYGNYILRCTGVLIIILCAVFIDCRDVGAKEHPNLEKVSIQLKWFHQFQFAGYYTALHKGFYKAEGLDVDIIEGGPKVKVDKLVISGKANYGVLASELILKRAKGEPVVLLAVIMQHSIRAIIIRSDSNISSPADLAGKPMMLNRNEDAEFMAMFKYEGVPLDKLKIISKDKTANTKFIKGSIEALNGSVANQPFLFKNRGLKVSLIKPINYGIDFYGDSLFTSEKEVSDHPERVAAFRRATLKGWEYAMQNPNEIIDLIISRYNLKKSRDHLRFEAASLRKIILPDLVDIGHLNPHRIERIMQTYKDIGMINSSGKVDGLIYNPNESKTKELIRSALIILMFVLIIGLLIGTVLIAFNRKLKDQVMRKTDEIVSVNKELQRNIKLLYSFIEGSNDPIYVKDLKGRYVLVNTAYSKIFGSEPDLIYGKTASDIMPEEIATKIEENDNKLLSDKKPLVIEEYIPVENRTHVFLSSKIVFYDQEGNPEGIFGIAHDVTEIKNTQEALRKSEEQLRSITETSPDYIMQLDLDLKVKYINRLEQGVDLNRFLEVPLYEFAGEEKENVKRNLESVISKEEMVSYETTYKRADGKILIFETIAAPSFRDEKINGITVISRDITQRKKSDEDNKKLETYLQQFQKMEAIGTLAGGIAHDFNNILGAISGYTEIVWHDHADDENVTRNLDHVLSAVRRAKSLVNQILTFSKQHEEKYSAISIPSVVEEAADLMRGTIPSTIKIKRDINSDCGNVFGDSTQIHQVVMNLCTNAYHAMIETGGVLGISLSEIEIKMGDPKVMNLKLAPGNYVKLSISDTGIGMDKSTLEKIFNPYFTTKEKKDGSGMGLAVTHGIIKNMGGHISTYSEPGRGSNFCIFLPVMGGEAVTEEVEDFKNELHGDENVLFVDDEKLLTRMMKRILGDLGYNVSVAVNGLEALTMFESRPKYYDIVITDMTMPEMDGARLSQKLLKIDPDLPIILCSGFSEIINMEKAKAIGIKAFLTKPVTRQELLKTVRDVLDD